MKEEKFDIVGDALSDMDRASRAEARMLIDAGCFGGKDGPVRDACGYGAYRTNGRRTGCPRFGEAEEKAGKAIGDRLATPHADHSAEAAKGTQDLMDDILRLGIYETEYDIFGESVREWIDVLFVRYVGESLPDEPVSEGGRAPTLPVEDGKTTVCPGGDLRAETDRLMRSERQDTAEELLAYLLAGGTPVAHDGCFGRIFGDAGRRGEKESREASRLQGCVAVGARKEAGGGRPEEGPAPGGAAV